MSSVLPFLTLLLLGWPLARTLGRGDLWQMLRSSRRICALVAAALAAYVLVGLAAFMGPPALRWVLVLAAVAVLVYFLIRTGPGYGRRIGLPPGPLALISQMDQVDDRHLLRQAEIFSPLFKTTQAWRPTICLVGLGPIEALLRQHDDRLTRGEMPFSTLIPNGFLRFMSREAHERYRPILAKAVAMAGDEANRPVFSASWRAELAQIGAGDMTPHKWLPAIVQRLFIQVFFGIAPGSQQMARFEALYTTLDCRRVSYRRLAPARDAMGELVALVRGELTEDGAPSVLAALAAEDPELPADETVVANLVALVQVGSYDLASLLVWIVKMLSDHPDWQVRLRDQLAEGKDDLADRIISETLRLEQSEYLKRTAIESLAFDGFSIPEGWNVQMCLRESHQDPAVFAQPRNFDPDRFAFDLARTRGFAPFGIGKRRCPAQRITYLLANCFLLELVPHYTWRVMRDGPRRHDGIHWTPSLKFRIRLSPVEDKTSSRLKPRSSTTAAPPC